MAGGTISTAGGEQKLKTADPTGADVLLMSGSNDDKAIVVDAPLAQWIGVLVATGGIDVAGQEQRIDGGLIGRLVVVRGINNVFDGRPGGT